MNATRTGAVVRFPRRALMSFATSRESALGVRIVASCGDCRSVMVRHPCWLYVALSGYLIVPVDNPLVSKALT